MSEQKTPAQHTVKEGETLSHLALKYYGSTEKDKWMRIYEANKAVIGDNPAIVRPGLVLNIPAEGQEQPKMAAQQPMRKENRRIEE
jgi:nucleoid-associated protein YgaU